MRNPIVKPGPFFLIVFLFILSACFFNENILSSDPDDPDPHRRVVLFLGDSLTAGYGLDKQYAYPSLMDSFWKEKDFYYVAKNAGISGDTTSGALARLDPLLISDVHLVFLAIGINDGLRGYPLEEIQKNLQLMIQKIQEREIKIVLAGMRVPVGPRMDYPKQFAKIYKELAKEYGIPLFPFLLKGVAARPKYNLSDRIHPNREGHKIIAQNVLKFFNSNWDLN